MICSPLLDRRGDRMFVFSLQIPCEWILKYYLGLLDPVHHKSFPSWDKGESLGYELLNLWLALFSFLLSTFCSLKYYILLKVLCCIFDIIGFFCGLLEIGLVLWVTNLIDMVLSGIYGIWGLYQTWMILKKHRTHYFPPLWLLNWIVL